MLARGFGWPGSVFTVGTCRWLLLALLLEPSIVTTVSDIILRRSGHLGSARSRPGSAVTSVHSSWSERRRGVNRWGSKMENRTGIAVKPIAGHLLYVHHGPCAQRLLPLRTTYSINSFKSLSILSLPLCYIAATQHSAGSIDANSI